jgi:hypothetical protein
MEKGVCVMDVPMRVIQCCECFVAFAMTTELYEKRLKDHKSFYCPVGHGQHFVGKSDEEQLKEKLKQKEKLLEDKTNLLAEAQAAARRLRDERIDMVDAFLKEQFKKNSKGILLKTIAPQLGMKTGELYSFLITSATGIELSRSGKGWMVSKKQEK